jgi:hypothetical protein
LQCAQQVQYTFYTQKSLKVKKKHKLVPVPAMKVHTGSVSLTSVLDGGHWSSPHPSCFIPCCKGPLSPMIRGLGRPYSHFGYFAEEENLCLHQG